MEDRLDTLLERGKESLGTRRDTKTYASLEDIRYLVQRGAKIVNNNRRQEGNVYLQEVVWQNKFLYVTTTAREVKLL